MLGIHLATHEAQMNAPSPSKFKVDSFPTQQLLTDPLSDSDYKHTHRLSLHSIFESKRVLDLESEINLESSDSSGLTRKSTNICLTFEPECVEVLTQKQALFVPDMEMELYSVTDTQSHMQSTHLPGKLVKC